MILQGIAVSEGIGIGRVRSLNDSRKTAVRKYTDVPEKEREKLIKAGTQAEAQLEELYQKTLAEAGKEAAEIFLAQKMMLRDPEYLGEIEKRMAAEPVTAAYAVKTATESFLSVFENLDEPYFRERSLDLKDVSELLLNALAETEEEETSAEKTEEPFVFCAETITPSGLMKIPRNQICALITANDSLQNHTAILCRIRNIPAITGIPIPENIDGQMAVIDGNKGILYLDPDEKLLRQYKTKTGEKAEAKTQPRSLRNQTNTFPVYANISGPEDLTAALENGADGIGLYRTEFAYLQKDSLPTEEELFQQYRTAAEKMSPAKVIIRTVDFGGDKTPEYLKLPEENAPSLRGTAFALSCPDILRAQLRAIYRASAYGNLAVMFPMIHDQEEFAAALSLTEEIKQELSAEGTHYANIPRGCMIETRSAVTCADQLAETADFFSIGTNDLEADLTGRSRYIGGKGSSEEQKQLLLETIRKITQAGKKRGIPVGICGELASDPALTGSLIPLGINSLSVNAVNIKRIREQYQILNGEVTLL